MPPKLTPIKAFKCTFDDCDASFDTEKEMKRHKKYSEEHDYCSRCNLDFKNYDDYTQHKAFAPEEHGMACRICGEEFKSKSGLKRHIELCHKVDQKLPCIGCGETFFRASLLTEHLEFGHCPAITAVEFQGHIVHKFLITKLLEDPTAYQRFQQKTSRFDAADDKEETGGIDLLDPMEDPIDQARDIDFKAIKPEGPMCQIPEEAKPYPRLPTQVTPDDGLSDIISNLEDTTLEDTTPDDSSSVATSSITNRTSSAWSKGRASKTLFPKAPPTPAPPTWSIQQHDDQIAKAHGTNIMKTRFWDPTSSDWNPERFLDAMTQEYYCPFICEQHFSIPDDLDKHIMHDHRIATMKCPSCLRSYKSATALVAHCESRGARCQINKAEDYNKFLDRLTGGFLSVQEKTRPDHLHNPTVRVFNPETGRVEDYTPPQASYLQYKTSTPPDFKVREHRAAVQVGPKVRAVQASAWK